MPLGCPPSPGWSSGAAESLPRAPLWGHGLSSSARRKAGGCHGDTTAGAGAARAVAVATQQRAAAMWRARQRSPGGSAALRRQQERALHCTMRIVRELGPTAFVLREERGPPQRVRLASRPTSPPPRSRPPAAAERGLLLQVLLGAPHSCTCAAFRRERDLCAHLCW